MSKKTNRHKQAKRAKPRPRPHVRNRKTPNPAFGTLPSGVGLIGNPGDFLFPFVADQILLAALKKTGIRDAFVKLLVKQLDKEQADEPTPEAE